MKFAFRQAWVRLTCLTILAVVALVTCQSGPGVAAPTVKDGAAKAVGFNQGQETRAITLSGVFTGENLTFSAPESNTPAVATASIANGTLIITAVSPGTATITVTATNAGGSVKHEITVTVPEPTTSEPEPGATPTVKADAPDSVEFDQGQTTRTVTLDTVFEEQNLEFTETSSDPDVATASITTNGILVIRAGDPGEATITVTATNAGGRSASHRIAVNVPEPTTTTQDPPPTTTSASLTIKLGESATRTLPGTQTLQPPASGGVEVEPSPDGETGNVWLITALKKGTHTIAIFSGGAKPEKVGSIVVEVPNSPPVRKHDEEHPTLTSVEGTGLYSTATSDLDLYRYFDDPDGDKLRFRVGSKPSWVLIDSENGFVKTTDPVENPPVLAATNLTFEVLEKPADKTPAVTKFDISLYAVDDSGSVSSRPVIITLPAPADMMPRIRAYSVQQGSNGALSAAGALRVGPRLVDGHTVTFKKSGEGGFAFARRAVVQLGKRLPDDPDVTDDPVHYINESGETEGTIPTEEEGAGYYLIKSSGAVVAKWESANNDTRATDPKVTFKLKRGSSGTIRIEYHVWALAREPRTDEEMIANHADRTAIGLTKKLYHQSLTIHVVTCSSPPKPLTDCPGKDPS